MSEEMARLVAESIIGIDLAYEPPMAAEDVIIFDLLADDAECVKKDTIMRLFGLSARVTFDTCQD